MSSSDSKKRSERNGAAKSGRNSGLTIWARAVTPRAAWPDKDEFLDVIYWSRQVVGLMMGVVWGIIPMKGFIGIALFAAINTLVVYVYSSTFQRVDEEEFGGTWEIVKEGFMTSFAGFLVTWIIIYSAIHFT